MSVRKQIIKSEQHMSKKFPELKACFYVSRRNIFLHMRIGEPLFSFKNYSNIIAELNLFLRRI